MNRIRPLLFPALICVAGLVMAHHQMVLSGFAVMQNDLGDTRFCNYLLEHAYRWATFDPVHGDLWSPPYFYPTQNTLAWAENMLGAVPFYAVWRLLGFEVDSAFQAWILTVGAMNFVAAFFFFRRCLSLGPWSSSFAAALFAFAGIRINQTMHYQLFPHAFTFWAFHAAYRLLKNEPELTERQRVFWVAAFFGATTAQIYVGIYLGWFLVFALGMGVLFALPFAAYRRELIRVVKQNPFSIALSALVSAAALLPLAWRYLETAKQFGGRPFEEALTMIPRPHVWLHLGPYSWLYGWMAKLSIFGGIPMEHEQRIGFGLVATALAAAGLWLGRKDRVLRFLGAALVVLLLASTLYGSFTPWKFIYDFFPGAKAIRGVSRVGLLYLCGVAVFVAVALNRLESMKGAVRFIALPLGLLVVLEQGETTPVFSKADNRRDIHAVASQIGPQCKAFLLSPMQGYAPYWKYQLDAMMAQLERGLPTLNGYSGQNPPGWELTDTNIHSDADAKRVQEAAGRWIEANKLDVASTCWVQVGFQEGPYQAVFVSQRPPPSPMKAGSSTQVEVVIRNTGTMTWPANVGLRLGSQNPPDSTTWGLRRAEFPAPVEPGKEAVFRFDVVAPATPGTYDFQWRMVHDGVRWFGDQTPAVQVQVTDAAN